MRAAVLALAAVAATLTAGPSTATPPADGPRGSKCQWINSSDPRGDGDERLAEIYAGPLLVVDGDGLPASGTLTCTIQVGRDRHSDPDDVALSAHGTGVVEVAGLAEFRSPTNTWEFWCTEFAYDGGPTLYWSVPYGDDDAAWTTDPDAFCDSGIHPDRDEPLGEEADPYVCPGLAGLRDESVPSLLDVDETGDVALAGTPFWDCPPYDS